MNILDKITATQINPNVPEFRVGDTVRVDVKIIDDVKGKPNEEKKERERIQAYEGIVTSRKGSGVSETFTVRKKSMGVGVERTFPVHSPKITKLTVVKKGKARRAKLHFLREKKTQNNLKERN